MKRIELLSPAKNLETAIAAINCGADAVYIGAENFGARKLVSNSIEDLKKLVDFAHKFYVRVHVTINTILNDSELQQAIELIKRLYDIGIDAIIVQDMAIIKAAIEKKIPPIQIHTSTQCNTRTFEKTNFFDNIGVSRIVLARELSIEEIKYICQNTTCEIETFIHGALCVSYSGQCYLSFANGGRSANKGECAQPCRKKYSLIDENGKIFLQNKYLLSMKDFNASKSIQELIDAGVNSFKIEGRLKSTNYVKNVTAYYNNLLNDFCDKNSQDEKFSIKCERASSGKVFLDFEPALEKTFNRGFTTYFLHQREQCFNFISPKSKGEKIGKIKKVGKNYFEIDYNLMNPQDGICFISNGEMKGFLVNKIEGNKIFPNKMDGIKSGIILYRNFNSKFEKDLSDSSTTRKIKVDFTLEKNILTAKDEDNNIVNISLPKGEQPKNSEKMQQTFVQQLSKSGNSDFYISKISINNKEQIPFYPISVINEFRRNILDNLMQERLKNYPKLEQKQMNYTPFPQKNIDYRGNVMNDSAKEFYEKCNCEVLQPALERTNKIPKGIELMRTKHCLKYSIGMCSKPCKKLYLMDENNKKYPLKFDCKNCEMVICSP